MLCGFDVYLFGSCLVILCLLFVYAVMFACFTLLFAVGVATCCFVWFLVVCF